MLREYALLFLSERKLGDTNNRHLVYFRGRFPGLTGVALSGTGCHG